MDGYMDGQIDREIDIYKMLSSIKILCLINYFI